MADYAFNEPVIGTITVHNGVTITSIGRSHPHRLPDSPRSVTFPDGCRLTLLPDGRYRFDEFADEPRIGHGRLWRFLRGS